MPFESDSPLLKKKKVTIAQVEKGLLPQKASWLVWEN